MAPTPQEILSFLGLSDYSADKATINELFARGFPVESMNHLCQAMVLDMNQREGSEQTTFLTPQESHLLYRLTACWLQALRQAKKPEHARRLLIRPDPLLWGARPIGMALLDNQGWRSVMANLEPSAPIGTKNLVGFRQNHRCRKGRLP